MPSISASRQPLVLVRRVSRAVGSFVHRRLSYVRTYLPTGTILPVLQFYVQGTLESVPRDSRVPCGGPDCDTR